MIVDLLTVGDLNGLALKVETQHVQIEGYSRPLDTIDHLNDSSKSGHCEMPYIVYNVFISGLYNKKLPTKHNLQYDHRKSCTFFNCRTNTKSHENRNIWLLNLVRKHKNSPQKSLCKVNNLCTICFLSKNQ